mgnify:CR=1 FL=1
MATLLFPVVLPTEALIPKAVFDAPVVFNFNA